MPLMSSSEDETGVKLIIIIIIMASGCGTWGMWAMG